MAKTHNIFISHSWQYGDAYLRLCNLLNRRAYFHYVNYSIPKDNPIHTGGSDEELILAIKNKMRFCHVILIMAGVYSTYSKWINAEIMVANNDFTIPKPIIGIKPRSNCYVSTVVRQNAIEIVNWNTESIVSSVRRNSLVR